MQESKTIYFDVDQVAYLINNATTTTTTAQMKTYINNEYWVDMYLVSNSLPVDLSEVVTFRGAVGNLGSTPLINIPNSEFNNVSAWSEVSLVDGRINCYLDMSATNVKSNISTAQTKGYYLEVQGDRNDGFGYQTMLIVPFTAINVLNV